MSKFWSGVILVGSLATILGYQNCGGQTANSTQSANGNGSNLTVTATVTKAQAECSQLLICSHDNTTNQDVCFLPMNMDTSLLNAGNVVTVKGTVRTDLENICLAQTLQVEQAQLVSGSTTPVAASN